MKFITVSGIDKSGKTSIIDEFMKQTHYINYVVDRDPSNYHALSLIQDRIQNSMQIKEYYEFTEKFVSCVDLAIFLSCDSRTLMQRFTTHNEPPIVGSLSFEAHQGVLENEFDKMRYKKTLKFDTSHYSIQEVVDSIVNTVKEI